MNLKIDDHNSKKASDVNPFFEEVDLENDKKDSTQEFFDDLVDAYNDGSYKEKEYDYKSQKIADDYADLAEKTYVVTSKKIKKERKIRLRQGWWVGVLILVLLIAIMILFPAIPKLIWQFILLYVDERHRRY